MLQSAPTPTHRTEPKCQQENSTSQTSHQRPEKNSASNSRGSNNSPKTPCERTPSESWPRYRRSPKTSEGACSSTRPRSTPSEPSQCPKPQRNEKQTNASAATRSASSQSPSGSNQLRETSSASTRSDSNDKAKRNEAQHARANRAHHHTRSSSLRPTPEIRNPPGNQQTRPPPQHQQRNRTPPKKRAAHAAQLTRVSTAGDTADDEPSTHHGAPWNVPPSPSTFDLGRSNGEPFRTNLGGESSTSRPIIHRENARSKTSFP